MRRGNQAPGTPANEYPAKQDAEKHEFMLNGKEDKV